MFSKSSNETKTNDFEIFKASVEIIMGWPWDLRIGGHFVIV